MRTIGDTIKLLREERRLSQQQLADILEVGRSTISMYESGARIPDDDVKELICDYFNVDMNYIFGKTNTRNSYREENQETITKVDIIFDDYFPLHYCTNLSAGTFQELIDSEPNAIVYVPIKYQSRKKRLHAFMVNGTSMDNVIADGSIVVAETVSAVQDIKQGSIVVVWSEEGATVKRIYTNGNQITLLPDSSDKSHKAIMINTDVTDIEVVGRVVWHMNPDDIEESY